MAAKHNIHTVQTSIAGIWHKAKNLPCQDYCQTKTKKDKFVAVVSDGAGSARYGKIGAKIICETLCDLLVNADMKNIRSSVIEAIQIAREKLTFHRHNRSKSAEHLVDFSATLVGAFYQNEQGIFFHIGDGAGLAFRQGDYADFVISEPANGAFSCETYFYTMADWQNCLRFTPFCDKNRLILMTDGVTGFVFSDDFYQIRPKFLVPIVEYLEQEPHKSYAEQALRNTLEDKRAQRLNADDKTILWAKLS
ncbi:MAG: protein phosphatase 2C domain-containing protein [Alphaproteobacteria bacterium]|nr:protein phosphatase 2C domain-containing protein [Alphaproteobacteria bacterium]